jgi:uncharacterized protein
MINKNSAQLLEQRAFSRIGIVVEINGKNIVVKVDKQKNSTNLFYKGETYRNVGIGSYLKIKKDFMFIIGKIEKEFIKEKLQSIRLEDESRNEKYDRFIELSVIGYFERGNFKRGIRELPFLYNEAFLMSENELKQVFRFTDNYSIHVGKAIFEDINVEASINKLFASHIGIFGNTGSGKSNTLSRLYYNLFNMPNINLKNKSKFIIIDFNGEYTNSSTITNKKTNFVLSTRRCRDRLSIEKSWLDEEFWGIILQATEKTQKPFIKRTLKYLDMHLSNSLDSLADKLASKLKNILVNGGINRQELDAFNILKQCIKNLFNIENESEFPEIFRNYSLHNGDICRDCNPHNDLEYSSHSNGKIYFSKEENIKLEVQYFHESLRKIISNFQGEISYFDLFEMALGLRLMEDLLFNIAQFDHVAPILHRFQKRKNDLKKIFCICENDFLRDEENELISISLKDVNIEMKKIIPLLLCKKIYENHKSKEYNFKTLHLIIDEAHNILSEESFRESESWKDYRLEVFEEIIKEGRKFGVFLTISSQRPSDISNTIISQLHNVFIHRLINNNDLQTISRTISFLDKISYDSISILPPGGCIFTGTATETPIAVQIPLLEKEYQPESETALLEKLWFNENS